MEKIKRFRNKKCVCIRTKTPQECLNILKKIGYIRDDAESKRLPDTYTDECLIITFYGGVYTIVESYPSFEDSYNIFNGREFVHDDIEEFTKIVSEGKIVELCCELDKN